MASTSIKAKGSAAGQYLGYALQPVRLCYHLLSCDPNATASIEHIDDVSVNASNNSVLLEQTKSALKQNPVADWADDLWKTFANWADNVESGLVDPTKTQFRLYVTPPKSGKWVQRFNDAKYSDDVLNAISEFRAEVELLPRRPKCHKYISRFLAADNSTITAIISNFLLHSDENPVEPIRQILSIGVQDAILDHCCAFAIGLAKETADSLIRHGTPAIVEAQKYRTNVKSFISRNNLVHFLPTFASPPSDEFIERTLDDRPIFVQQLDIVDMPHDHVVRAISDLLQSAADKTHWAEKGLVANDSFFDFDKTLTRQHQLRKLEIDELHGSLDPSAQGRLLYSRCATNTAKLEGREVPNHFLPGCYNDLADRLELGWHPTFQSILQTSGS